MKGIFSKPFLGALKTTNFCRTPPPPPNIIGFCWPTNLSKLLKKGYVCTKLEEIW